MKDLSPRLKVTKEVEFSALEVEMERCGLLTCSHLELSAGSWRWGRAGLDWDGRTMENQEELL